MVHCSGQWAAAEAAAWRPLGLAAARERCDGAADTSALYAALCVRRAAVRPRVPRAGGRVAGRWRGDGAAAAAAARLARGHAGAPGRPRRRAAVDRSAEAWGGGGEAETRLPFAVDGVLMRGPAAGVLWAVASASGADAADVALGGGDGVG